MPLCSAGLSWRSSTYLKRHKMIHENMFSPKPFWPLHWLNHPPKKKTSPNKKTHPSVHESLPSLYLPNSQRSVSCLCMFSAHKSDGSRIFDQVACCDWSHITFEDGLHFLRAETYGRRFTNPGGVKAKQTWNVLEPLGTSLSKVQVYSWSSSMILKKSPRNHDKGWKTKCFVLDLTL